ncbi:MAG: porin family protein [Flavobacteriaceae bacterium]
MVLHAQAQLFSKERLANLETFDNRFLPGVTFGTQPIRFQVEYETKIPSLIQTSNDAQMGFNVGLIGDLRINRYMNLRLEPGIYFTQRNLIFPGFEEDKDKIREVKSTYIHVPLLLKLSTKRINNFKPFIVMGISRSINLASNEKNPEDNFEGKFRMTRGTGYYELGFGIDLYLYYFKFSPSIRGVFASSNELVPDDDPNSPWTSNISALQTRGIFLNFTFQ